MSRRGRRTNPESPGIAKALPPLLKLAVLGVVLYVAFWAALLLLCVAAAVWNARNADWETPKPEWRNGLAGYGLYTHDCLRIYPYPYDDD